jgi:hypothetical protein
MKRKEVIKAAIHIAISAVLMAAVALAKRILSSAWISDVFKPLSRRITRALSFIFGPMPFSAAEMLLYLLVAGTVVYIFMTLVQMIRRRLPPALALVRFSRMAFIAGVLVFIFNTLWGFNYYSLSLADEIGLEVGKYSINALRLTTESFVEELNRIAGEMPRDADGVSDFGSFGKLAKMAVEGWEGLARSDPAFSGAHPSKPKPVLASKLMSYAGITGIYIPFTGEANVNADIPDSSLPFTMSHELAHAVGVAPENEANYAAFLACRINPNIEFRYSGYLNAFIYCYNALAKEDPDLAFALRSRLDRRIEADLRERWEYWKRYEGRMRETATRVNNAYLMAMSQKDGVKSYGMVVDLLIADYVSRNGNPDVT